MLVQKSFSFISGFANQNLFLRYVNYADAFPEFPRLLEEPQATCLGQKNILSEWNVMWC